jgi:hypothetical protein
MRKIRWISLGLMLVLLAGCRKESPTPLASASAPVKPSGPKNAAGINYVSINPDVYVPGEIIAQWSQAFNDEAIADHAWDLWSALNADSGEQYCVDWKPRRCVDLPVWDTWFSEFEVFHVKPQAPPTLTASGPPVANDPSTTRPWHLPRQITTRSLVVSFNKYNLEFKDFVEKNKYYDPNTLDALVAKYNEQNTPLDQRLIVQPPTKGIMLKPTFWLMYADKPTPVPIWKGPGDTIADTTYPERPTDLTWKNIVLVDPTGQAKNDQDINRTLVTATGTTQWVNKAGTYQVVPLDSFYYVPLSQQDIEFLLAGNAFQLGGAHPELGGIDLSKVTPADHLVALLVGMHVTTAEWPDFWTFQTFFWAPNEKQHPSLKAPFTNFDSVQAYYMVGKDGKPHIAFNPHLETPIEGPIFLDPREKGSHSNCMTCHRAAAWPSLGNNPTNPVFGSYIATGNLQRDNSIWFRNRVQTMNMWTMVLENLAGKQHPSNTPANPSGPAGSVPNTPSNPQ